MTALGQLKPTSCHLPAPSSDQTPTRTTRFNLLQNSFAPKWPLKGSKSNGRDRDPQTQELYRSNVVHKLGPEGSNLELVMDVTFRLASLSLKCDPSGLHRLQLWCRSYHFSPQERSGARHTASFRARPGAAHTTVPRSPWAGICPRAIHRSSGVGNADFGLRGRVPS